MLVFCNGMPRSASTWSFNVVKALLECCFPGEEAQSAYTDSPVQFLRSAALETRHVVLKCHSLTPLSRTLARICAAKVVFTTRDLSDAVASTMSTFDLSFERAVEVIMPALPLHRFHRETGNAVILHYEEIASRPRQAIWRIGEYLAGCRVTGEIVEEIAAQTSFERMRQKVEEINAITGAGKLAGGEGSAGFDPETMLHRNHMGDGRSGKGSTLLTATQLDHLAALTAEYGLAMDQVHDPTANQRGNCTAEQ